MITVGYRQRTIYEPLAVNVIPDYKDLLWAGWLLKVDKFLEDEDLVKIVRDFGEAPSQQSHARTAGHASGSGLALDGAEAPEELELSGVEAGMRANVVYREFTRIAARRCRIPRRWCVKGKLEA